jgi:hypothetical protein
MKLKIVVMIMTLTFSFTSINSIAKAADCSEYKALSHKWIMCQAGRTKDQIDGKLGKDTSETNLTQSEEGKEDKLDGVKSSVGGFFKKIKNFGGKNVGEEG